MSSRAISFDVLGTPAPKGSSRAIMMGGRPQIVPNSSTANAAKRRTWDANVRDQARLSVGDGIAPPFVKEPLAVSIVFRIARPRGHWGKGRNEGRIVASAPPFPITAPDIDKLARATLDSLTGIVFDDDSRISSLSLRKVWARPGDEGAHIEIDAMTNDEQAAAEAEAVLSVLAKTDPQGALL